MTAPREFTRAVQAWLQEDGHEDVSRLLASVGERVAREPQDRPAVAIPRALGASPRVGLGLASLAAVLVIAVIAILRPGPSIPGGSPSPVAPSSPGTPSATPGVPVESPATTTRASFDPAVPGIANDAPCTRTWPTDELSIAPQPFHHEDLEQMVLAAEDVGGLAGFEQDVFRQGYHDNAELPAIEIGPDTTCQDTVRFGRIEGYGNAYASTAGTGGVLFAVHLFWTAEEGAAWVDAFTTGLEAAAAATDGAVTFEEVPGELEVAGATLYRRVDSDGTRTWAFIERGPIVGWVVDAHAAEPTIDVAAATELMATRIESVSTAVAGREPSGLDAARLLSATLPRSAYGELAAGLEWDSFFGGCQDAAERSFIVGPEAVEDAQRFGRATGCTGMFSSAGGVEVVRVFSIVEVYRDGAGASGALAANVAGVEARGGSRFDAQGIGDEAIGVTAPGSAGEEGSPPETRVVARVGSLLLVVSVQGTRAAGQEALLLDLARQLDERVSELAAAD